MITRTRMSYGAAALIAMGALAVTATSASNSASMPAATPSGAASANLRVDTTTVPKNRLQARRASSYTIAGNGPRVQVGAFRSDADGLRTLTVAPAPGRKIFQGFATLSGGKAGVGRIVKTQVVGGRYVVNLSGVSTLPLGNSRLTLRVQSILVVDDESA